jgi:hypothetical protein
MLTPTELRKCDRIDIIHIGSLHDGYQTFVIVDGIKLPEMEPKLYDKEIEIHAIAGEPLQVIVLVLDKEHSHHTIGFLPTHFDMDLGVLGVHIIPDRSPCKITIGGYEPGVRKLFVRFAEGECIIGKLEFMLQPPLIEPIETTNLHNEHIGTYGPPNT